MFRPYSDQLYLIFRALKSFEYAADEHLICFRRNHTNKSATIFFHCKAFRNFNSTFLMFFVVHLVYCYRLVGEAGELSTIFHRNLVEVEQSE